MGISFLEHPPHAPHATSTSEHGMRCERRLALLLHGKSLNLRLDKQEHARGANPDLPPARQSVHHPTGKELPSEGNLPESPCSDPQGSCSSCFSHLVEAEAHNPCSSAHWQTDHTFTYSLIHDARTPGPWEQALTPHLSSAPLVQAQKHQLQLAFLRPHLQSLVLWTHPQPLQHSLGPALALPSQGPIRWGKQATKLGAPLSTPTTPTAGRAGAVRIPRS